MKLLSQEPIDEEVLRLSPADIRARTMLMDGQVRILRGEVQRINHSVQKFTGQLKENKDRIEVRAGAYSRIQ